MNGNAAPAWKIRNPLKASSSRLLVWTWQPVKATWALQPGNTRDKPETSVAAVWVGRLDERDQIPAMNSQ
jgi:hypothetical protein